MYLERIEEMNLQDQVMNDLSKQLMEKIMNEVYEEAVMEQAERVEYGYNAPFYWVRMPDGTTKKMITKGKMLATLAVVRINDPHMELKQIGKLKGQK